MGKEFFYYSRKKKYIYRQFLAKLLFFFYQLIMDQSISYKHKIDFLISNDTSLSQPTQATQSTFKPKRKKILCNECNKKRVDVNHQVCRNCYRAKKKYKLSRNKVIDDFISYTLIND